MNKEHGALLPESGAGVYVTDIDIDGHTLLQGVSGLWGINAGFGQESVISAVHEQLNEPIGYPNYTGA